MSILTNFEPILMHSCRDLKILTPKIGQNRPFFAVFCPSSRKNRFFCFSTKKLALVQKMLSRPKNAKFRPENLFFGRFGFENPKNAICARFCDFKKSRFFSTKFYGKISTQAKSRKTIF